MAQSKAEKLRYRMMAIEAIRAVRKLMGFSYRELSRQVGIDETLLARYSTGITVPSYEAATKVIQAIRRSVDPARIALAKIGEQRGLLDLTPILTDPNMLKILSIEFHERFRGKRITKILVPEAAGVTLATALSLTFDASLVVARRMKENPMMEYIEEHILDPPSGRSIFYVPKGSIRREDGVLIVDDIVQTGMTLAVMKRIVERSGAELQGVAAIAVVGDEWRKRVELEVESIIRFSKT